MREDCDKGALRKHTVSMEGNDGAAASFGIVPAKMATFAVAAHKPVRTEDGFDLPCGEGFHARAAARVVRGARVARRWMCRSMSMVVRTQHFMASRMLTFSSSRVSATVKQPGMAGISAQYSLPSLCMTGRKASATLSLDLMACIVSQSGATVQRTENGGS